MDRRQAIARFAAIVEAAATVDAARTAAAIVAMDRTGDGHIDVLELLAAAGFGSDATVATHRLLEALGAFRQAFDFQILLASARLHDLFNGDAERSHEADLPLSGAFARLVDGPPPPAAHLEIPPRIDATTLRWLGAVRVAAAGESLHLALRCRRRDTREMDDLAGLLVQSGVPMVRIGPETSSLEAALLGTELHAGPGTVVIVGLGHLARAHDEADSFEEPGGGATVAPNASAIGASSWLGLMKRVHVWCIPANGKLDEAFDGFIGGCIGPIAYDAEWAHALAAGMLPGVGDIGAAALAAAVGDPRDAMAVAITSRHLARGGRIDLDEACAVVARSIGGDTRFAARTAFPADFDPRLLVCDEDALTLLDRAEAAARNGARVVAHGAPGGGKSTYAQALVSRMADAMRPRGDVVVVTPAAILAKPLGATERLMEALWARAAGPASGPAGVLLIDELDAMCGVRDPDGGSSGNAYLVRFLTDQWLRCFDLHPGVPVLATVNDVKAVDGAVMRRFHLVLEFGDELSPDAERLAWTVILRMEPPPGWRACGAAVADFASAASRGRIIGATDAASMRTAVLRARDARRGPRRRPTLDRSGLH